MVGKLHHFVPRFYLKAWANRQGKLFCLQDGNIRRDGLRNVAAENYFYKLNELSAEDVNLLRELLIKQSPEGLRSSHEQLLGIFTAPYRLKRGLAQLGKTTAETDEIIDRFIVETNEDLHTRVEEQLLPRLNDMLSDDLDFLDDPAKAALFYRALALQYVRTNHVEKNRPLIEDVRFKTYERLFHPMAHILAANIGLSLFAERTRHKVILLENATPSPFVTADQPIINIASHPRTIDPPTEFELYYPISPTKAIMIVDKSSKYNPGSPSVSATFVEIYNLKMAAHSFRQVFSNSSEALASVQKNLPAYLSCL